METPLITSIGQGQLTDVKGLRYSGIFPKDKEPSIRTLRDWTKRCKARSSLLGARPMRATVERYIQDAVVCSLLNGGFGQGRLQTDVTIRRLLLKDDAVTKR